MSPTDLFAGVGAIPLPLREDRPRSVDPAPRPLRVLLISHTCQSRVEGQPKAVELARLGGFELRVLTPDRWREYGRWRRAEGNAADSGFDLHAARVRWPWAGPAKCYLHWYPQLRRLLEDFKPDVIDIWEEPWGLVSAHACWLRDRAAPGARIVCETEQNTDKKLPFPFERFRSYTLGKSDFVVGRNAEAIDIVRSRGYRGPAAVVPNAVDADLFRPMDRAACREQLGLAPPGCFVAGYVGRLVEEKGVADLLEALPQCPDSTCLVFVGSGPMREPLQARGEAMGITDRVRFLAAMPLEKLPAVMNAIDVLVLPSRTTPSWKEQFGRVIIEAHACQTPVIGSDSGAIPDVIGAGGLVVAEGDRPALARAVAWLHSDPRACREFGRAGRRQVEDRYTWRAVAGRMAEIYRFLRGEGAVPAEREGAG